MNVGVILAIIVIISTICYCIAKCFHFDEMYQPTWKNMFFDYSSYALLGSLICCMVYCGYYVFITIMELV